MHSLTFLNGLLRRCHMGNIGFKSDGVCDPLVWEIVLKKGGGSTTDGYFFIWKDDYVKKRRG